MSNSHALPASDRTIKAGDIPCCPELSREPCCDRITFDYRLMHQIRDVPVEVKIRVLLERCPGPLALGDLVYSTTLLPGEQVRLFTSNRKSRFTFDQESQVSYRHEQTSEETFYMTSMSHFMSDLSVREDVDVQQSSSGSARTEGSVSGAIESFFFGPSASASGSYNASSTFDFARELTSHAESSHERSVQATRAASSVAVGEVQSRSHAEGESESSFEASTRTISNPNRCHAVTYFAYQINKTQTIRFKVVAITRRVVDPAGDTKVALNPPRFKGEVSVIPQGVLATRTNRVAVESIGRASSVADRAGVISAGESIGAVGLQPLQASLFSARGDLSAGQRIGAQPIPEPARKAALEAVDKDLVAVGLLDKVGGNLAPKAAELSLEITSCLPTPAILVKGCLDECNVCEPALEREIELDLQRKELKNKLLERQIELLEKSQEYRCCPAGEAEKPADA
jgi:hypothetical protein